MAKKRSLKKTIEDHVAKTYLLCWNPLRWNDWEDFDDAVERTHQGESVQFVWSTGNRTSLEIGQRIFLYRQGSDRGIIASGHTASGIKFDDHWDESGRQAPCIDVEFDRIVSVDSVLPTDDLMDRIPEFHWKRLQASGVEIADSVAAKLEHFWQEHTGTSANFPNEVTTGTSWAEGSVTKVTVNRYERNANARRDCIDHYGPACVVCNFDFESAYGQLGRGFIHVHHLKELASIGRKYKVDPVRDLRPLCPNCHAMIHQTTPAMTIAKLKNLVKTFRP